MPPPEHVRSVVVDVLGSEGDETILDYIVGVLGDEDFEFGNEGEGAYEALGPVLVDSGFCTTDDAARKTCKQLAHTLTGGDQRDVPAPRMRALDRGPVALSAADSGKGLLYDVASARHLIQTPLGPPTETSAKERAKMERRAAREEAASREALAAHTARAEEALRGNTAVIVRNRGGYGSKDLHLENFSISNGGKELISDATVTLSFGRRYGLVGRNGTGKTTLLRALAAHEIPGTPATLQVLHVEQEVVGDDTPVLEAVLSTDVERTQLLQEEKQLLHQLSQDRPEGIASLKLDEGGEKDAKPPVGGAAGKLNGTAPPAATAASGATDAAASDRLLKVYARLQEIDADGAAARAAAILSGLSFSTPEMSRPTREFSGGWRMRVALARALFVQPDLLLLDEPTNHLDLHAVLWLEDYLVRWPKTLLLVSHAREFLNGVCTDVLHLHSAKLTAYRGNYAVFEKTMKERQRNARKAAEAQEMKRKHVQAFIDKFRFNAKRASLVQSRLKALERLADVDIEEEDPDYLFRFPDPAGGPVPPPVLSFNDVDFAYPGGPTLFRGLNFGLDLDSRFAIVGPNGIGKSTLLGLIYGTLEATKGVITRSPKVRMATFSQHHVDGLDLALTPLQVMLRAFPLVKDQELRSHLGSFGVGGTLALQPMYTLSGGQKSRVALAKITWTKPHILLLDEPSNHLDMDAVDALISGLALFKGGVLMVSHDQYLIESTVDELWMCEGGAVQPFHGTFEEYKKRLRTH